MRLVVHLVTLEVDLGYVIDNLAPFLPATEEPLEAGLLLLSRRLLLLLLLLIHLLRIERAWLALLMRGYELLLGLPFDLFGDRWLVIFFHLFLRL
jgi:hypothetical protein